MLETIFVPLDGSSLAEQALAYAERLAEATSAELVLSRVMPLTIIEPPEDDLALADEAPHSAKPPLPLALDLTYAPT